jgi:pseudaminic acid cytidylyltransferase
VKSGRHSRAAAANGFRVKNIKLFCGKLMIAWSITATPESGCFDHVAVSTDDEEIAEVARLRGVQVSFVHPLELSDDETAAIPVFGHAMEWFR